MTSHRTLLAGALLAVAAAAPSAAADTTWCAGPPLDPIVCVYTDPVCVYIDVYVNATLDAVVDLSDRWICLES